MLSSNPTSKSEKSLIRVLTVDDMPQVRDDLRVLLQLSDEIEVIGEAANGQEAIRQAELLHPDVVIMDLEMPIMDGAQATAQIKQRKLAKRVVILSVHSQPEDIARAMQSGADAFVQKGSPYNSLFESIIQNKPVKGEKK
jgi:DNA-binding NarL/FixJ family response regulator